MQYFKASAFTYYFKASLIIEVRLSPLCRSRQATNRKEIPKAKAASTETISLRYNRKIKPALPSSHSPANSHPSLSHLPFLSPRPLSNHSIMSGYHCPTCFEQYTTPSTLQRHIKTVHRSIKPVPCPHCEAHFRDRYCLRKHLPMHDPEHTFQLKRRALDWEGAERDSLVKSDGKGEMERVGGMMKSELQGNNASDETDMLRDVIEDNMQSSEVCGLEGAFPSTDEENQSIAGADDCKDIKPHRPGPKPAAPALRKRPFEFPRTKAVFFECFLCETRHDLHRFQSHVKGHMEEVKGMKEELMELLREYASEAGKMNATISSLVSQEDNG